MEISASTWSDEFELPDGSNSIADIQDYFEYVLKKHGENIDNPSVKIYVDKIENRITFKIKTGAFNLKQALDADPRAIQQISFTANLDRAGNTTMFFIIEEAKETVLDFSHKEL